MEELRKAVRDGLGAVANRSKEDGDQSQFHTDVGQAVDWLEGNGGMGGFQWDRKALAVMSGMVGRPVRVEKGDGDKAVQWAGRVLRTVDAMLGAWWKGGGTRGTGRLANIWEKRHWLRRLIKGWRAQVAGWEEDQEGHQEENREQTARDRQGKRRGRPRKGATDWRMGWRLVKAVIDPIQHQNARAGRV